VRWRIDLMFLELCCGCLFWIGYYFFTYQQKVFWIYVTLIMVVGIVGYVYRKKLG